MPILRLSLLAVLLAACTTGVRGEDALRICDPDAPPSQRLLWNDPQCTRAGFVPQALFDRHSLEDLPLGDLEQQIIRVRVRSIDEPRPAPYPARTEDDCSSGSSRITAQPPGPQAVEWLPLLDSADTVFLGRAVHSVAGWDTSRRDVGTATYFEVVEVFKGEDRMVSPGSTVVTVEAGGDLRVEGIRLCRETAPDFPLPAIGSLRLLVGSGGETAPLFRRRFSFPISGESVQPLPVSSLADRESIPLTTLRSFFGETP